MGGTGTAILDFGVFPGMSDTSVAVIGQAAIVAGSLVEAWIRPVSTADHTADEHMVETLKVIAGNIAAGTGFTIYGFNTSQLNEPVQPDSFNGAMLQSSATAVTWRIPTSPGGINRGGGKGTRIYGQWTVAWAWN
jgi:hypothetical protein